MQKKKSPANARTPLAVVPSEAGREQKRKLIEAAAYRAFVKHGYHQTAVDDICEAAGISKGSFYWYFASKQAVFHQILDTWIRSVEVRLDAGFGSAARLPDTFTALTAAMENEIRRHRGILPVWLEFLSQAERDPELKHGLRHLHERARNAIERFLKTLFGKGMTEADRRAFASMIMACFIGLSCESLITKSRGTPNLHLERFMEAVALRLSLRSSHK